MLFEHSHTLIREIIAEATSGGIKIIDMTFEEFKNAVVEFAEKNPDCLNYDVISYGDFRFHKVLTNKAVEKGFFDPKEMRPGLFNTHYYEDDDFKYNAVCVGGY